MKVVPWPIGLVWLDVGAKPFSVVQLVRHMFLSVAFDPDWGGMTSETCLWNQLAIKILFQLNASFNAYRLFHIGSTPSVRGG